MLLLLVTIWTVVKYSLHLGLGPKNLDRVITPQRYLAHDQYTQLDASWEKSIIPLGMNDIKEKEA